MSKIAAIEDLIIARITAALGNRVPTVEWAPPDWDEDFIKRLLLRTPGALLIFGGAERVDPGGQANIFKTIWTVVAATRHVQEAKARARGDALMIGCYEILEAVISRLNGWTIPQIGTLECIEWQNDIALKLEKQALMVQSAMFEMVVELSAEPDGGDLVPFLRCYAEYHIGQPDGALPSRDLVNLPQ